MECLLELLTTDDPTRSVVFNNAIEVSPALKGRDLFLHHSCAAICRDSKLNGADEQVRGVALSIWDGLSAESRHFWAENTQAATVSISRSDWLVSDGSTELSKCHQHKAATALDAYKQSFINLLPGEGDMVGVETEAEEKTVVMMEGTETGSTKRTEAVCN